jgi:hypothetical protein
VRAAQTCSALPGALPGLGCVQAARVLLVELFSFLELWCLELYQPGGDRPVARKLQAQLVSPVAPQCVHALHESYINVALLVASQARTWSLSRW